MYKFTKNIVSYLLLFSFLLILTSDLKAQIPQEIECEIAMDCCTVDLDPNHKCCCDLEGSDSSKTKSHDIFITPSSTIVNLLFVKVLVISIISPEKYSTINFSTIDYACFSPTFILNTISHIYYNSSLLLIS
ncbi:hypothetical protein OAQ99_06915 [Candidatus Kapabacteria bacterium]|nr:hypothetical protein [Candidatus Kapabacteria bacterium]